MVSANSRHELASSEEGSWEGDASNLWHKWGKGGLYQQPFQNDVLMESIKVLELAGTQSDSGAGAGASVDLGPCSHGVNVGLGLAVSYRDKDL
jgi:hypothetical protein